MSNGWSANDVALSGAMVVGASATDTPVSKEYGITAGGALNHVVKIVLSDVTVSTGITAKLQTAVGDDWEDSKTATVSADGSVYIKLQTAAADDQTFLPLLNKGRVVISTGSGDTATVDSVSVLQYL